ncbi:putative long-chain-alcohol O-fatty-acyltransferase 5 [Silene latifolia]|uniref:putative long-chain-alcohol O-fatty-acyltransferase 5 n=1 Tax=Silene latifolia TaxID=37657 RepID=UPI003D784178
MFEQQEEESEIKALLKVWLQVFISLIYSYFLVSKLPKGKFRVFALLPVFYIFTLLPLSLSTPTTSGLSGFFFTWLGNFKLLLFAFNLGPLSHDLPRNSFFGFVLVAAFPIKIKQDGNYSSTPSKKKKVQLPLSLWSKFFMYVVFVGSGIFCYSKKNVNPNILLGIYCGIIYLSLEVCLGFYNKLLGSLLGVELSQPFNEPYLSTSLQDFWGRRWNLMVSDVLRQTIYFPVRTFWGNWVGKGWAQGVGTMAAFVVSGLMHELLFYYITRASPTWEVTCFFLLHGVCLVMEIGLKRALGLEEDWALNWALGGPLTIGLVIGTGFWLFLPQLIRNQVDVRSLEEVKAIGRLVESISGWNLTQVVGGVGLS